MKRIAVILSDGFEEIEGVSVIDVLRRASCSVEIMALENTRVTGAHGITIEADEIFNYFNSLDFDGIVFVGGMQNATNLSLSNYVIDIINHYYKEGKMVAGICATPSLVFSKTEIVKKEKMTCYPTHEFIEKIGNENYLDERVVVCNNVITSQSPATALDFALNIVKYLGLDALGLKNDLQGK